MKYSIILIFLISVATQSLHSQEVFAVDSINRTLTPAGSRDFLAHPYEITYVPDDSLYITEKIGSVRNVSSVTGLSSFSSFYFGSSNLTLPLNLIKVYQQSH